MACYKEMKFISNPSTPPEADLNIGGFKQPVLEDFRSIDTIHPTNEKPYNTGDIIVTNAYVSFIDHYVIVFYRDNIPYVAGNSFTLGNVEVQTLEEFLKTNKVLELIKNTNPNITDELVEIKIKESKNIGYNFFSYNCEDFVKAVCGCKIGIDQRLKWMWRLLLIILFLIILILIFKR